MGNLAEVVRRLIEGFLGFDVLGASMVDGGCRRSMGDVMDPA